MGRKRDTDTSKKRIGRHERDSEDERMSRASIQSVDRDSLRSFQSSLCGGALDLDGGGSVGEHSDENVSVEPLNDALDKIEEKRQSVRLEGLGMLLKMLQSAEELEAIFSKRSTIIDNLFSCVRREGSEAEQAARSLSALCVCLGPGEDEFYRRLRAILSVQVTRRAAEGPRIEACRALAIGAFVCASDSDEMMDYFAGIAGRVSEGIAVTDTLVAAALEAWSLLATSVPDGVIIGERLEAMLPEVLKGLESGSSELRTAAGECAAVIKEIDMRVRGGDGSEESGETYEESDACWEEIAAAMLALSTESSKKLSKDAKKLQHRQFRDLHAAITEGSPPTAEQLALRNGSLEVTTWAELRRLNAFRTCLQGGLQRQLQTNSVVRDILNVEGDMSLEEGGAVGPQILRKGGGARKYQSRIKTRDRDDRQSVKDNFLFMAEEDDA